MLHLYLSLNVIWDIPYPDGNALGVTRKESLQIHGRDDDQSITDRESPLASPTLSAGDARRFMKAEFPYRDLVRAALVASPSRRDQAAAAAAALGAFG